MIRSTHFFGCILFVLISSSILAQSMSVRKWRKTERDSLDNAILLVEEEFLAEAAPIFEALLNQHPKEGFLKYSFAKCALYRPDKHVLAYSYLKEVYDKNKSVPDIKYEMALASHYNNHFDEALLFLNQYALRKLPPEDKENVEMLRRYISNAPLLFNARKPYFINPLDGINTSDDELGPVISLHDNEFIYNYDGVNSKGGAQIAYLQADIPYAKYNEDILVAFMSGKTVSAPRPLDSLVTALPDIALGMSYDGRVLFVYKDIEDTHGDIYQSDRMGNYFSKPRKLKGEINSYSKEGRCSLSPDGKTMYFSSDRPGGKGGRDLYRASLSADSTWGNIVNLGDSVNTRYDEEAPFIQADGVTLFFSSEGHNSMGDYDIFSSTLDPKDSTFTAARNMGSPLNTTADEGDLVVEPSGKRGYYSAARSSGKGYSDIFSIDNIMKDGSKTVVIKGNIKADSNPVVTAVTVLVNDRSEPYTKTYSRPNGGYRLYLAAGSKYTVNCAPVGFEARNVALDLTTVLKYEERNLDLKFETVKEQPVVAVATPTGQKKGGVKTDLAIAKKEVAGAKKGETVTKAEVVVTKKEQPVSAKEEPLAKKDDFVPKNKLQEKTMAYADKYGNITDPGLEFRVQLSAVKGNPDKNLFPARLGRIDYIKLGDGFTRITVGGSFKTIRKAFEMNKKIVKAGYNDSFVIAIYNGKRVQYGDLEGWGIFK
jgi:hypothetical protein